MLKAEATTSVTGEGMDLNDTEAGLVGFRWLGWIGTMKV
jgi:hypothetical protein